MEKNALEAAKKIKAEDKEEITVLSTGIRVKLNVVTSGIMQDVLAGLKAPRVPIYHNKDLGRDEENPNDPEYKAALAEFNDARAQTILDTLVIFGVDLVDPVPEGGHWIKNLKRLVKMGRLSLENYDLTDPDDLEFLYKRYIAVGNEDFVVIRDKAGITVTREEVDTSRESFRSS